jgi:hypothetical protein
VGFGFRGILTVWISGLIFWHAQKTGVRVRSFLHC